MREDTKLGVSILAILAAATICAIAVPGSLITLTNAIAEAGGSTWHLDLTLKNMFMVGILEIVVWWPMLIR